MRGMLVALEGIDGAGKTTQLRALERVLAEAKLPYVSTKEPTAGPWGQKIRESARRGRMGVEDELEAFLRDRQQHVAEVIEPALAAGNIVLVDRYYPSTIAYQGARGLDLARLRQENAFAPKPDLLIVLDIDPGVGLERVRGRGDHADCFERHGELERVREIFLGLDRLGEENLYVFDARQEPGELARAVAELVLRTWAARSAGQSERKT